MIEEKKSSIYLRESKNSFPFIFLSSNSRTRPNYDASSGSDNVSWYFVPREQISSLSLETERFKAVHT